MRKAIVAGVAAVALVALAFAVAPIVRSQGRSESDRKSERRVFTLGGRGSAIGVSVRDVEASEATKAQLPQAGGVMIENVDDKGPAAKAGIRAGDIIVEFDGERVRSARHFSRLVQETPEGRSVKTTVVRDGARQTVNVTPDRSSRIAGDFVMPDFGPEVQREIERGFRDLPRNFAFDFNWDGAYPGMSIWPQGRLGAQLSPLSDQLAAYFGAKDGVLVSSVDAESAAANAGLKAGDVITAVNGRSVDSPRDVMQELRHGEDATDVEISILRDKKPMTLKAQLPEPRRSTSKRSARPV